MTLESKESAMQVTRRLLDPALHDLSPRHLEIYWRYQVVRTGVDFGAALCFVVGSVLFFFEKTTVTATWFFLVGSILFAVKPTIDMVRSMHLRRLPVSGDSSSGKDQATHSRPAAA
ncbi:MAG TPA: YrhK family protein [Frankiaceae bacterium]|nr:YrhK family protein [Frankiaceae bacterium]